MARVRKTILFIAILLTGGRLSVQASEWVWPRSADALLAQATRSIPAVQEFRELYPDVTFSMASDAGGLLFYVYTGLYQRYTVSLKVRFTLTADRRAMKSWEGPAFELDEVGEIHVAEDDQGYTEEEGSIQSFDYERFKVLKEHGGDFASIGIQVIQDQPRTNFDRVWKAGHPKFVLRRSTFSPRGLYGVKLPVCYAEGTDDEDGRKNELVEVATGRVVAVVDADPGYDRRLNFHEVSAPRWSPDESLLLWKVDGKWNSDALVLLKLRRGRQSWQLDLLKTAQQALLRRTKKAAPKWYEATKKDHVGWGSAYPDGFVVDVTTDGEGGRTVSLPLAVRVNLTADSKVTMAWPKELESWLDGVVSEDGRFVVKQFHLGHRKEREGR